MYVYWPSVSGVYDVIFVVDHAILVVVFVDVCCCCVHACNGDLLVLRKFMVVCR